MPAKTAAPPPVHASHLKTSARHLREIVVGLSDGVILIGPDQCILWANPCALAMHGVAVIDALGATVSDYRDRFHFRYHGDRSRTSDAHSPIERLTAGDTCDEIVDVSPAGDGDTSWTHRVRTLILKDDDGRTDGFVLILDDETERYDAETRFEQAFSANPAPAAILRLHDFRFVRVNHGFLEMTGYREDEVIGRSIYEIECSKARRGANSRSSG